MKNLRLHACAGAAFIASLIVPGGANAQQYSRRDVIIRDYKSLCNTQTMNNSALCNCLADSVNPIMSRNEYLEMILLDFNQNSWNGHEERAQRIFDSLRPEEKTAYLGELKLANPASAPCRSLRR